MQLIRLTKELGKVIYHGDEFNAKVIPNDMRDYDCTISVKMREFRRSRVNTRSVSGRSLDKLQLPSFF